jgi:hypothetical protein
MERLPVNSSSLASVGYNGASETLEIEFQNQTVYEYYNVPQFIFEQLMQAPSVGVFFNANIKDIYACSRV